MLFLSLGVLSTARKLPPVEDVIPVDIVDIAAVPSAPNPTPRTAPALGPDQVPEPAEPEPQPTPPEPTPEPEPAPAGTGAETRTGKAQARTGKTKREARA